MNLDQLTISRPDDWHLHLRDGSALADSVPHSARNFRRAIVMPNLATPIITCEQAQNYRAKILQAAPAASNFEPLMTLYLTDSLSASEIRKAHQSGIVYAVKYYPAGATTNSDSGV
ncbi:MAG: amidohydrolase family protein, partial [Gammaproteobacteria bacterium]|nr:amidohydrolase family protein [Gammaproteobacteria bacterium]